MTPRFLYLPFATLMDYTRSDRSLKTKLQANTMIKTDILNKEGGPPLDGICARKNKSEEIIEPPRV